MTRFVAKSAQVDPRVDVFGIQLEHAAVGGVGGLSAQLLRKRAIKRHFGFDTGRLGLTLGRLKRTDLGREIVDREVEERLPRLGLPDGSRRPHRNASPVCKQPQSRDRSGQLIPQVLKRPADTRQRNPIQ